MTRPSDPSGERAQRRQDTGKKTTRPDPKLADAVRDSAQQIWQAGLGALAQVQGEGGRVFETLAQEGLALQRQTQAAAEEKVAEVTDRMTRLSGDLQARTAQPWDRLESIFEDRVAKALVRLGVPEGRALTALIERVGSLSAEVDRLSAEVDRLAGPTTPAADPAPRKKPRPAVAARKTQR